MPRGRCRSALSTEIVIYYSDPSAPWRTKRRRVKIADLKREEELARQCRQERERELLMQQPAAKSSKVSQKRSSTEMVDSEKEKQITVEGASEPPEKKSKVALGDVTPKVMDATSSSDAPVPTKSTKGKTRSNRGTSRVARKLPKEDIAI
ncbi:hypothetical protein FRC03_008383 [Tulasnella sp. 419]|nr:hypothetical protein FRC03_008383 [Tulasnella sp. 419]